MFLKRIGAPVVGSNCDWHRWLPKCSMTVARLLYNSCSPHTRHLKNNEKYLPVAFDDGESGGIVEIGTPETSL